MTEQPIEIYRAVLDARSLVNRLLRTDHIMRPPLKVPYVVDNLWEWVRPEQYPSRRFAAFASPRAELAEEQGADKSEVCQVELCGEYSLCQVKGYRNAKDHPDCIALPIFLFERLGDAWIRSRLDSKNRAGRLWMPDLDRAEVEFLFKDAPELAKIREPLRDLITFWSDVKLIDPERPQVDAEGELFFEAPDGYYLRALDRD